MKAPFGLSIPKGKCLRLQKSLYGLKQSGKLWNDTIHNYLLELGFMRSRLDPCLYFHRQNAKLTVLGLYVDDVVVVSQRESDTDWVMNKLAEQFQIKDMGPAKKCLGIHIEQCENAIYLHQSTNIDALLCKLGMENCRSVATPMESTRNLHNEDSEPFFETNTMREAIGSLLWLSNCTRPDITMPVNYLARFVASPTTAHWTAVKRVLRYLHGSRDLKLAYFRKQAPQREVNVAIYSDADWAGDKDAKSTSGGLLTMNCMPIAWYSKKQSTVALSTAEAEYIAGATAVQDCLWVKQLIDELASTTRPTM
ncbi:polyprotein [Phytophthora megakarya]|uniref:Polyprotein n=1 Tax=Phytophthora megakarya TaxID=4795 RepID=A0A225UXZ8_9STRA|nr:polyprotein [Phytophthora megakarya]